MAKFGFAWSWIITGICQSHQTFPSQSCVNIVSHVFFRLMEKGKNVPLLTVKLCSGTRDSHGGGACAIGDLGSPEPYSCKSGRHGIGRGLGSDSGTAGGWQGHVSVEIEMAEEVAGTMVCCKLRGYTYPLRAVLQWQGHWEDPSGRILAEKQVNAKYVQVSPWMNYKEAVETLSVLRTVSKTIEIHGGTPDLKQLLLQKMAFGAEEDKEEAPVGGN